MIEGLRPYPEMQTTGHPWLPSIPSNWEVRRNGRLFSERRETGYPDLPILEVSLHSGVRIRDMEGGKRKQQITDRAVYQRAVKGDIAYNMMRMWQGAVGIAPADGLVSPAYVVASAHDGVDPAYYAYLFRTDDYMKEIDSFSRGIVPDRNRLYWQAFKQMPSAYPPLDEQRLIIRFLDWHGAMTGRLIRAKRRLIALLNEQKQSAIHRAVTRGLDPAAKFKPSNVDWLGDVPEHWEVGHLRYLTECLDGQRIPLNASQRGEKQGCHPYWGANKVIDHLDEWLFDEPLVLLGEDGAPFFLLGRDVAFAVEGKIWVNNHAHVLRCGRRLIPSFLATALNCVDYVHFIDGSTRDKLTQGAMGSIHIQVPPLDEQRAIVDHLDGATSEVRMLITKAEAELKLIQEFRTRLIADVVTGQLDVRAVAASLPDVANAEASGDLTDEDDLDDDVDTLIDEEEAA